MTPGELARLEAVEALANRTMFQTTEGLAGLRNRAVGANSAVTTPGQATITAVGAAKLIAGASGLFWASVNIIVAASATDSLTLTVASQTDAVAGTPLTLNNAAAVGPGTNGIAQPGNVAVTNNGTFASNAGAGITVTGGQTLVNQTNTAVVVPTGLATQGFALNWSGFVRTNNGAANPGPFTLGTTCLLLVSVTDSNAARAISALNIHMFELP